MPDIHEKKTYEIDGDGILLYGKVFHVNDADEGSQDVFVVCTLTGDEYAVNTRDATFTLVNPETLEPVEAI